MDIGLMASDARVPTSCDVRVGLHRALIRVSGPGIVISFMSNVEHRRSLEITNRVVTLGGRPTRQPDVDKSLVFRGDLLMCKRRIPQAAGLEAGQRPSRGRS